MLSRCRLLGRLGGAWVSDLFSGSSGGALGGVNLRGPVVNE